MSQPALLNRTHQSAFLDNLQTVISSAGAASVGLLVVQLKSINDLNLALGYRTVDAALSLLASRLAEGFSTRTRVVRVGTGRFAIVLDALKSEAHALLAANKVQRLVEAPFDVQGCKVKIDVVQGVALFPQHAANGEDLFRCAEGALDLAKNQQAAVVLYSPEKVSELNELHRIDGELTRALEHGAYGIDPADYYL
ncbi:MAG TPA: diguanylate cyclase [Gammaproteobacteria bacterium]|nr:diguanylate cyclase [Gammaproteobacteria bacterium]